MAELTEEQKELMQRIDKNLAAEGKREGSPITHDEYQGAADKAVEDMRTAENERDRQDHDPDQK